MVRNASHKVNLENIEQCKMGATLTHGKTTSIFKMEFLKRNPFSLGTMMLSLHLNARICYNTNSDPDPAMISVGLQGSASMEFNAGFGADFATFNHIDSNSVNSLCSAKDLRMCLCAFLNQNH